MLRFDAQRARRRPRGTGRYSALAWLLPGLAASAAGLALANGTLATVGSISIDASSFRQRAARVGPLDWGELGATWPERRRRFLDEVLIAEALLALAAERAPPALPSARDRALALTLDAAIVRETSQLAASDAEVRAYRERHAGEFQTQRALGIWRILLATEAEARAVIAELAKPSADAFSRLARERSIDPATHMRAGNLGLVAADGQTAVPELRVSPALFAAADRVGDGELVPEPVREGDHFAVVWRRSTRAASAWPEAEMAATIAARLAETRASVARQRLLATLRRDHLGEYHPDAAAAYEPSFPEPTAARSRRRIEAAESPRAPSRVRPELTDRGLR